MPCDKPDDDDPTTLRGQLRRVFGKMLGAGNCNVGSTLSNEGAPDDELLCEVPGDISTNISEMMDRKVESVFVEGGVVFATPFNESDFLVPLSPEAASRADARLTDDVLHRVGSLPSAETLVTREESHLAYRTSCQGWFNAQLSGEYDVSTPAFSSAGSAVAMLDSLNQTNLVLVAGTFVSTLDELLYMNTPDGRYVQLLLWDRYSRAILDPGESWYILRQFQGAVAIMAKGASVEYDATGDLSASANAVVGSVEFQAALSMRGQIESNYSEYRTMILTPPCSCAMDICTCPTVRSRPDQRVRLPMQHEVPVVPLTVGADDITQDTELRLDTTHSHVFVVDSVPNTVCTRSWSVVCERSTMLPYDCPSTEVIGEAVDTGTYPACRFTVTGRATRTDISHVDLAYRIATEPVSGGTPENQLTIAVTGFLETTLQPRQTSADLYVSPEAIAVPGGTRMEWTIHFPILNDEEMVNWGEPVRVDEASLLAVCPKISEDGTMIQTETVPLYLVRPATGGAGTMPTDPDDGSHGDGIDMQVGTRTIFTAADLDELRTCSFRPSVHVTLARGSIASLALRSSLIGMPTPAASP